MDATDSPKMEELKLTAQVLRTWRERMGYSQRQAALALGCSRGAWSGWEDGTKQPPRYIGLACAALALGMKISGSISNT